MRCPVRKWPGPRAEFDDSKKPQVWHLIRPGSETVNNNAECGMLMNAECGIKTMRIESSFRIPNSAFRIGRSEWHEIKDRVDRAAVATPVRLHSRQRSIRRSRNRKGNLNARIATTDAPAKTRSRFPGAGPRPCPEYP